MKISNYNFYYPLESNNQETLIYNSRTNALALIENDNLNLLNRQGQGQVQIEDSELQCNLLRGGFIVADDLNELDLIRLSLLKSRFSDQFLGLTIAPTMDCNFNCIYCYEKGRQDSYMSAQVQQALYNFTADRIDKAKHFSITWYGGEPLLALDTIEELSRQFIRLCAEQQVSYSAGIVTNGYQLTTETAKRLQSAKVSMAQITLDGSPEIHDQRRPLASGQGSFATILNNIQACAEFIDITIRINTDQENAGKIDSLIDILESSNLKDKVNVYLGFVDTINDCYLDDKCLSRKQSSHLNYLEEKKLSERCFICTSAKYPKLYGNFCGADNSSSYVVDPDGFLYKCWNDIGLPECAIGNVLDLTNRYNNQLFSNYMLYMPTDDPQCKKCKLLPICMGGCPHLRVNDRQDQCSEYKYNLESYIRDYAKALSSHSGN